MAFGAFFVGFGSLTLYVFLVSGALASLGVAIFCYGVYALIFIVLVLYSSRFEFYEDGFIRKYKGGVRQEVSYSDVEACRYIRPGRSHDSFLLINAVVDGANKEFMVKGNPKNRQLGVHLRDWLKTKVRDVS